MSVSKQPILYKTSDSHNAVILSGSVSYTRNKAYYWHSIRNMRTRGQKYSPIKSDGSQDIGGICDIQIAYNSNNRSKIRRINKFVYLLARHSLGEETTQDTAADQIYITPQEFIEEVYIEDMEEREKQQEKENNNFVINNSLEGCQELIRKKISDILQVMFTMAKEGGFDSALEAIKKYLSE